MDQGKKDKIMKAYRDWSSNDMTSDEDAFAGQCDDPVLGTGFFGGYIARDAEIEHGRIRVIAALDVAALQMSRMEKEAKQDEDFTAALNIIRETLAAVRGHA